MRGLTIIDADGRVVDESQLFVGRQEKTAKAVSQAPKERGKGEREGGWNR